MSGPILANLSPVITFDIDPTTPVQFDVVDVGLTMTIILPIFIIDPNGAPELVHDGVTFTPPYAARSTRIAITNGYRYTCRRGNGWTAPPRLRLFAADTAGNTLVI